MATPAVASGVIRAQGVLFGPENLEFKVDRTSGQVDFKVGTPTPSVAEQFPLLGAPTYSTVPSTNITAATKNVDSINILNNWLASYLLESPPRVTNIAAVKDTTKIVVTYTLPPQKRLAFSQTTAPYIKQVRADIIPHAANLDQSWTGSKTTVVLESPTANAFATANTLELYVQAGTSLLAGNVYAYRNIITETAYDIRVYCTNESSEPIKYAYVYNVATDGVGPPAAPTGLAITSVAQTAATASWTAPADRDANLAGTQTTPFVASYRVDRSTTGSSRYGGAIADTVSSTTSTTTVSDSAATLGLTSLQPGTAYSFQVYAKNTVNPSYGAASAPVSATTLNPSSTAFLAATDSNSLDAAGLAAIRAPYLAAGGFNLAGAVAPIIVNSANMTSANTFLTYSGLRRTNFAVGATGTSGTLVAYGGPSATYLTDGANKASFSTQGFGTTTADGAVASGGGNVEIVYRGDADQYASPANSTGFYKVIDSTARAKAPSANYPPSPDGYSLALEYTPAGGTLVRTTGQEFFVDGLNSPSAVNNPLISAEVGSNTTRVSGVPTFTSAASFNVQHNQTYVASYFVRSDRLHANLSLTTTGGSTTVGATVQVKSDAMGASHKYYVAPASTKYSKSSTLSNTGTQLAYTLTPDEIQFNDWVVPLTAASATYDESLQVKVIPYSNYTNGGTAASGGYVNVSSGVASAVRIDAPSLTAKDTTLATATGTYGKHVSSGTGTYPASTAYTSYDHTQSLLANSDLQLLNGRFVTPAGDAAAYKNYSTGYYYGTGGLTGFDYSSITSASSALRYVTFQFNSKITTGQSKLQATLVSTGLTLGANLSSSNHSFTCMVVDSSATFSTQNLDCNQPIAASGLGTTTPVPDGTPCGDISSTVASRRFYINAGAGTSAAIYIRIGIPLNIAATITSCSLAAVSVFT